MTREMGPMRGVLTVMFEQRFVLLQVRQPIQNNPAHPRQVLHLGVNLVDLTARHVLANAEHLQLVHHRRLVLVELVH